MLKSSSRTKQCFSRYTQSFSNGRCRDETPVVEMVVGVFGMFRDHFNEHALNVEQICGNRL